MKTLTVLSCGQSVTPVHESASNEKSDLSANKKICANLSASSLNHTHFIK